MEIICQGCRARLNLPDKEIPAGRRLMVSCPACGGRQALEAHPGPAGADASGDQPAPEYLPPNDVLYGLEDPETDLLEENSSPALVMTGDAQERSRILEALQSLGYVPMTAETCAAAIARLRRSNFSLLLLADPFDGHPPTHSPVMGYLNSLNMSTRRHLFLTLLGDGWKTMDRLGAFALSAELVVNRRDLHQLSGILRYNVAIKDRLYKVFFETMAELGKV